MNASFYTAGAGVVAHQTKLNVVSNNMSNINTTAFKGASPVFADLMYTNQPDAQANQLQRGHGLKLDKTDINFQEYGALNPTDGQLDFAINGDGFFAVKDLDGEDVLYTRDGRFQVRNIEDALYLTNAAGKVVLDPDGEAIEITEAMKDIISDKGKTMNIGVYQFPIKNGMTQVGFNDFQAIEKNGEPEAVENPKLMRGYLEASNVNMAKEMTLVIEAQRAYSYSLKMVQTSDEIEQEVNSLRR